MASKEGSEYQNPIRFINSTGIVIYEKGEKAFKNQIKNTYAKDAQLNTFLCTGDKTAKGEPVWNRVNDSTKELTGDLRILVSLGKKKNDYETRTTAGKTVEYDSHAVEKRRLQTNISPTVFESLGSFVFLRLSESEIATINSEPISTTSGSIPAPPISDETLPSRITNSIQYIDEMYNWRNYDTNGRSGPGSTTRTTQVPAPESSSEPDPSTNRITSPTPSTVYTPRPDGSTNPSSPGGGGGKDGQNTPQSRGKTTVGGSAKTPRGTKSVPSRSTVNVNFLPDYSVTSGFQGENPLSRPYIKQVITDYDIVRKTRQRIERIHVFDIIPNSFEFSQLSAQWNEVERSANYPMVDWAKYNLTKCSFRFLVAGERADTFTQNNSSVVTIVNDGMSVSVDGQIENIRAMAGSPNPVTLYNLNTLLSTSFRFPYIENTRGIQWVIADMSVTATRLTPNGSAIAAAEISMTLTEYPIIGRNIIPLPPLAPDPEIPRKCKPAPCPRPQPKSNPLWTCTTYDIATDTICFPEPKD